MAMETLIETLEPESATAFEMSVAAATYMRGVAQFGT